MDLGELERLARRILAEEPLNRMPADEGGFLLYDDILYGVADAADPLFEELRGGAAVGPQSRLPREWLPEAKTVLSLFFSMSEAVRRSNRIPVKTSRPWLFARIEGGERLIPGVAEALALALSRSGVRAVVPFRAAGYAVNDMRSNWSERHVAYIAGLGTFGLSKSLITAKGSAGRLVSLVTDADRPATPRAYSGVYEHCSRCGACIGRCPAGAIDEEGKRHQPCADWLDIGRVEYAPRYGCGKCQTGVPCEARIPARRPAISGSGDDRGESSRGEGGD